MTDQGETEGKKDGQKEGSFSLATSEKTIAIPLYIDMSKVKKKKKNYLFLVLFVKAEGTPLCQSFSKLLFLFHKSIVVDMYKKGKKIILICS